eukprot:gnl/TRDRNA2_/TRDRNA2_180163_c0_seq1.p1 gnl/TRDRNA2_/TRDRNA2_180163_c0~~gnl/TRDRNA2_/TRDRNA2_180163_c0_seq1.p1  ORF type:complete len:342 (+),score=68.29 gnl/TRDRNA2_/TRDRNA2_180163_c0_seq1:74-1027(+)
MAPRIAFGPGEEDWQERFEKLHERFPKVSAERVLSALRANEGHAGYAAADLRELCSDAPKVVDAEDKDFVTTLLSSPVLFRNHCKTMFQKFDSNRNGMLEWEEVLDLTTELCSELGIDAPTEQNIRAFFEATDVNGDQVLSEDEFAKFFESLLRYGYVKENGRLVGTWRYSSFPGGPADLEFIITQTKDWRLQVRCVRCGCPGGPPLAGLDRQEARGVLDHQGGWLTSKLKAYSMEQDGAWTKLGTYGHLRLRSGEGGLAHAIITNYRRTTDDDWGDEVIAYRQGTEQQSDGCAPRKKVSSGGHVQKMRTPSRQIGD